MSARQPRAYLIVSGQQIPVISAEVTLSRTKKSDSFHAVVAIGGPAPDIGYWSGQTQIAAQVMFSNDIGQDTTLFDGFVDNLSIGLLNRTATVSGRDKSQKLVDTKVQKQYLNKKPDDIIKQEAQKAGLQTQMTSFQDKAGKLWQIDWNKFFQDNSIWTGINNLADHFGFNAYVTQGTLYVQPFNENLPPYPINYTPPTAGGMSSGNFIDLTLTRNLPIAQGASVNVQSWDNKKKKVISGQAGQGGASGGSSNDDSSSGPLSFLMSIPGLQKEQATRIANKRYAEVTSHEMTIALDMPGDTGLTARTSIQLSGTGSAFDTSYDTQSVEHRMSLSEGYRMYVQARIPGKDSSGGDSGGGGGGG